MKTETYWNKAESEKLYDKAVTMEADNKTTSAIELYQKAIKCWPKNAQANYNLGIIFATIGQLNQALRAWKRALWLEPTLEIELSKAFSLYEDHSDKSSYNESDYFHQAA